MKKIEEKIAWYRHCLETSRKCVESAMRDEDYEEALDSLRCCIEYQAMIDALEIVIYEEKNSVKKTMGEVLSISVGGLP